MPALCKDFICAHSSNPQKPSEVDVILIPLSPRRKPRHSQQEVILEEGVREVRQLQCGVGSESWEDGMGRGQDRKERELRVVSATSQLVWEKRGWARVGEGGCGRNAYPLHRCTKQ